MIKLKNKQQLEIMKVAGRITGEALYLAGEAVKEGVSTLELDRLVRGHIEKCGAKPSFL
jgi:methionyl aminopeptidase